MKLEERIAHSIVHSEASVFLRSDFRPLGTSESQLSRALKKLIECGVIQRVSHGAYVKTRINQFTGQLTPAASLETVAKELFARLGIKISPPTALDEYNTGLSTQVPAGGAVAVRGRKITRKITVAGRTVRYT